MIENAKWIGGDNLLRRSFQLEKVPLRAELSVTGLGYFVCYLNGKKVGDAEAAPSYTDYNKRVEFSRFEVSGFLQKGENVLAIMLGAHWQETDEEELRFKPYYKGKNMALCSLVYEGGEIYSDEKFKVHSSPILRSGIYDGETFDASCEPIGWKLSGYDDGDWQNAREERCAARLVETKIPPVRIVQKLNAVDKWKTENGFIYDFGVNIAGKLSVSGKFAAGAKITMQHAECIYPETRELNQGSLRTARATDTYVARGGEETYTPFFTYHGFRYAKVTSDHPESLHDITVIANVVHTDVKSVCEFETDNEQLNSIYAMMRRTFLNNLYSIPTDCHQRDERQGWLGDAQLSCESVLYCFDAAEFYRKYLDDIADMMDKDGNLSSFTAPPVFMGESLMWSGAYYMIVEILYRLFEDTQTVERHYSNLRRYYLWLEAREEGGFPQIGGLGDWLSIAHTDENQIRDAVYIDFTDKMALFARVAGDLTQAEYYARKCARLKKLYHAYYYSPHESTQRNSGYYGSCAGISQFANALPLCFDIPDLQDRGRIIEKLVYDLKYARGRLEQTTGLIGTKYLFDALEKTGNDEIALDLLLKQDYPSLGFMLNQGATTVWERWEYMTDNEMNSHCHTPLAAPCKWLITRLAGLSYPKKENDEYIFTIDPFFSRKLSYVQASLHTCCGKIFLRWERKSEKYDLEIVAPENCKVKFRNKVFPGGMIKLSSL